jgi:hypothetical protein
VAIEDTMHAETEPVLVSAPRVTLDEILGRVAAGEARRDSAIQDESFLLVVRVVGHAGDGKPPQLLEEVAHQVWKRRPNQVREEELRHWYREPPKNPDSEQGIQARAGPDMGEAIVNFAFRTQGRREYAFQIQGRELRGDHLVYRIAFRPRSPLAMNLPSGQVWVDTKDYVILRQEITFEQSPLPLFVRGVKRMVVERQKVGELWVLSRVLLRVETTIPIPTYGRTFDFGMQFTRFTVNTGLPDSIFTAVAGRRGGAR